MKSASISELTIDDLEEARAFQKSQTAGESKVDVAAAAAQSRWFLFDNPEAQPDIPKGWIARDSGGNAVGVKFCSPERFRCGEETFVLLMGGGFYVSTQHRGLGLRLMRAYLDLGDRYSHFATTMNEVSGALYEHYGGYPVQDTEHEMLGVLRWGPLVEEALAARLPRSLAWLAARAAALRAPAVRASPAGGRLVELRASDSLDELRVEIPESHRRQVTSARRPDFLRWRYFAGPDAGRSLWLFDAESGGRALVGLRLARRGHRAGVRTLSVLDYWGDLAEEAIGSLARLLAARFSEEADVIVFRCQPPRRQAALQQVGFLRRALSRPIGVCIDRAGRLPTKEWYMVPADGDMAT